MQQAIEYAEILQIPFVFTSNGDSFVFKDMTLGTEKEIALEDFPPPHLLWYKYLCHKGLDDEEIRNVVGATLLSGHLWHDAALLPGQRRQPHHRGDL